MNKNFISYLFFLLLLTYSTQNKTMSLAHTIEYVKSSPLLIGGLISSGIWALAIRDMYSAKRYYLSGVTDDPMFEHSFKTNTPGGDDLANRFRRRYEWSKTELDYYPAASAKMKEILKSSNPFRLFNLLMVVGTPYTSTIPLIIGAIISFAQSRGC